MFTIWPCHSSRMQAWQDSADVRIRGTRPLYQVQRNFPAAAHTTGIGGTTQNLWYGLILLTC